MKITAFQTLEDRDNVHEVESDGPFVCPRNNAWLGIGCYFWDTHIELAHWWGASALNNKYMITKAFLIIDENCWDLHGCGEHRQELEVFVRKWLEQKLPQGHELKFGK